MSDITAAPPGPGRYPLQFTVDYPAGGHAARTYDSPHRTPPSQPAESRYSVTSRLSSDGAYSHHCHIHPGMQGVAVPVWLAIGAGGGVATGAGIACF